uniref:polymorphic toxin-type HINT domain-containing protein n=1 Tax=Leptospira weilii TaxID=28184 RepID=UPI0021AF3FFA|nr:polymorphic toxin-type HINT domain-containing protein [Leptospira weilii]
MVTTVVAVAAAPFTGGASLMVAMAVGAGIGAATGAASGGLKGALVGAVGGAAGAAVKSFTGGAVNVGLSYSAENGFGASVGVGYGPATVSVGISERGGTSVDVGFNKAGFNAGLSYNSKTGSVSGSAGFTSQSSGTGFALSYSEGDGFGASLSKSFDSGLNGGLSWSEKGGVGGNIGYEAPGDKDKPKNSLANQMKGAGGTLSFSQRDGLSAALNASGGVNAGNWSQSGGFQANTNFLADKWKADFVSGKAKEDAEAQAKQREAQNRTGADVLNGAGYASAEDKLNAARKEALIHEMQDSGQDASKILDMSDADIAKELQKRGRSGDTNGNFGINEQGSSRTSILDHVLGSAKDFLVNNFTTGGASDQYGYVGSDGKYHQNVCFTAGTLVWTQEGLREIEEIQVGEKVLSWDEKTREMSYQPVIELFRRNTTLLFDLETEYGTVIETTWNHPFGREGTRSF